MRPISEVFSSLQQGISERQNAEMKPLKKSPEWEAAIKYIDSLPADYSVLVKKNGIRGLESRSGTATRNMFDLGRFNNYPVELIEYTRPDGSIKQVWYVIFNNQDNVCYRRDL